MLLSCLDRVFLISSDFITSNLFIYHEVHILYLNADLPENHQKRLY